MTQRCECDHLFPIVVDNSVCIPRKFFFFFFFKELGGGYPFGAAAAAAAPIKNGNTLNPPLCFILFAGHLLAGTNVMGHSGRPA